MTKNLLHPPSWQYWFGTDLIGNDIFYACFFAAGIEVITLAIVAVNLHIFALIITLLVNIPSNNWCRAIVPHVTHFWSSLPHLLLTTVFVILAGPGQIQLIMSLTLALLAAHILFCLSLFWEAERQEFITAKLAVGLPHTYILVQDIFIWMHYKLFPFTRARLPEIVMLHLALSFVGFGVRPPSFSLGRMLFDGIPFMFSAWWLWVFPAFLAGFFLFITIHISSNIYQPK